MSKSYGSAMEEMKKVFLGNTALDTTAARVEGGIVIRDNQQYYRISNYHAMPPFFMTLTGPGDHWLFISSNGGMTAGRRDPKNALFPYTTDDKIKDSATHTGSKTIFLIHTEEGKKLWEPFTEGCCHVYAIERNIYKSIFGNILRFEEINHSLKLGYSCTWQFSNRYGFVRTSELENLSQEPRHLDLLDGIRNILPYGTDEGMQLNYSTLVDAYKKSELDVESGTGIYYLSSVPTDKAEPSEGLKATTVWTLGLKKKKILLSEEQLGSFRKGQAPEQETEIRARRGAYLVTSDLDLKAGDTSKWIMLAELEQDRADVLALRKQIKTGHALVQELEEDLRSGTEELVRLVARADGLQLCADELVGARHISNVLYNIMRGGIFPEGYTLERSDFISYLGHFSHALRASYQEKITRELPKKTEREALLAFALEQGEPDLLRHVTEYLPLTFSRRHGDPSRPWNRFFINNKNDDGSPRLDYQGNWRDIFQNWEALAYSYPEYLDGMIMRFLNASTADGFNPYRIMKTGIEWEIIDPEDPWSNIGYWGDHQIIYLCKLLEAAEHFIPGKLAGWLTEELFVFTNVPYRIKQYAERLKDPRDTITYDEGVAEKIERRVTEAGADGKLVFLKGAPYKVNLAEKLLVPILAKLSNLVADGGIWLNTQRPEWNDANNALVGNGLSMVTVYYLRRHLVFLQKLIAGADSAEYLLSAELNSWMLSLSSAFKKFSPALEHGFTDTRRREFLDILGGSMDSYLALVYVRGFSGNKKNCSKGELLDFLKQSLRYLEGSIKNNRRGDGLYHAYNLMELRPNGDLAIHNLQEMLEGQVALLSSGYLNLPESLSLLKALRSSAMYRDDQQSYTLYPDKSLTPFMQKNRIGEHQVLGIELVGQFIQRKDYRLLRPDGDGAYLFSGELKNAADLSKLFDQIKGDYPSDILRDGKEKLTVLFEDHFGHHSFTGRSGTFFKYEGLGSIYWHMVSKLLLAVQEVYLDAVAEQTGNNSEMKELAAFYEEVKAGLGLHKSPDHYGAFPTDAYSHTPLHAGVQQPGMTGQVKEDILARWGELGLCIREGCIKFAPVLLRDGDFLKEDTLYRYYDIDGRFKEFSLPAGSLAFTYCQVPVVYHRDRSGDTLLTYRDGKVEKTGKSLTWEQSEQIFRRTGEISSIDVCLGG
ncbi:MAG: hypothetical protein JW801_11250 [Bacteroidales bacterium]|nr:hypothetical protein [Bacteroidales bacterium]